MDSVSEDVSRPPAPTPSTAGGLLIFDGDCGFCTTSARWAQRHLPPDTDVAPWQQLDLDELGLTQADVTTAAYWRDPAGRLHRGHLAAARAAIAMGQPFRLLGWVGLTPPFRWIAAGLYRVVASNRHRLPGATDACRLDA